MIVTRLESDQSTKVKEQQVARAHANILVEPPVPVPTQRVDRVTNLWTE